MMNGKLLGANVVYRILNVFVVLSISIFLSRLAGAAGFGVLSLLIANATIFNLLSGFGSDAGITYNTASGKILPTRIATFIIGILICQIVLLVLVEAICWFATGHYLLFKTSEFEYAWIGLLFLVSISLIEKYSALLYGRRLITPTSKILLGTNVVALTVFTILYFFFPHQPAINYIILYVLLNFLQAISLMYACHVSARLPFRIEQIGPEERKYFFSYSMLAFVTNVIQFVAYRVDFWLIDYYAGEEELGVYSLAVRLSQSFWVLPLLFAGMLLPLVAADRDEYEQSRFHALIRGMNLLNLVVAVVVFLLAPYFIPLLFGDEYRESIELLRILLPGVILFCMATVLAAWFAGKNMLKVNLGGSAICLVVILILDLLLIPSQGAMGAAIASTIGYGVTAIYFLAVYCTVQHVPISRLLIPGNNDRKYINGILSSVFSKK